MMTELEQLTQELGAVEVSIDTAKRAIARADALQQLLKNKNFKLLITDFYLGSEAARLVKLLADPTQQRPDLQQNIHQKLISIGQLDQFMQSVITLGDMARNSLENDEATQAELLRDIAKEN